jgi:hypothetical protein
VSFLPHTGVVAPPPAADPEDCELRSGVVAPLVVGERPMAALVT